MSRELMKAETVEKMQVWKSNWKGALRSIEVTKEMTYPELRRLDSPSVSMMNIGEKSTENGVMVFQALVNNIVEFLGAEWSKEQILETGKICFDEAHYLTFAELSHFAKKAKAGGFDKVYGKFTPITFMEWFTEYTSDNMNQRMYFFSNGYNTSEWTAPKDPVDPEKIEEAVIEFQLGLAAEEVNEGLSRKEIREMIDETPDRFRKLINESSSQKEAEKLVDDETK